MAQPNLVREPSMDEILASIRRIIESNDPVPQSGLATSRAEPEGFSGQPANDDSEEVTLTVDDAFAEREEAYAPMPPSEPVLRAIAELDAQRPSRYQNEHLPPVPHEQHDAASAPRTLSLADVAARVRAASERSASERSAPAREPSPEPEPIAAEPAQPVMYRHAEQPPVAQHQAPVREEEPVRPNVENVILRELQGDEPHMSDAMEDDDVQVSAPALMSSMAGEQVARSFQDLAIAFDQAERRSFDEIAEDLLRPMLQEWLDDNLPTLVERLVREEIERVARGTRR